MSADQNVFLAPYEERREGDFVRISIMGDNHCAAIVQAVVADYERITGQKRPSMEDLLALKEEKVTVVRVGENAFGASAIGGYEGRVFWGNGGAPGLLPKGKRSKGIRLRPDAVLDVLPGYCLEQARERVLSVRAHFPVVSELTQERLLKLPSVQSDTVHAAFFGSWQMPDCVGVGSIYLATNYLREDDILEGYLLIRPQFGYSEHGSCWGRDILRMAIGEIVGFTPISYSTAFELGEMPFDEAYAKIVSPLVPERV